MARPMPCPAAVTSATLFCTLPLMPLAFCPFNDARLTFCLPSVSKFSGASQRSKLCLRSGHSLSSIENQASSRLRPLAIKCWRNVPS